MSGGANWLPWRRAWSQYPNVWKVYVAYTVEFAAAATFYLADGRLFGVFWAGLAVAMLVVTDTCIAGAGPDSRAAATTSR